MEMSAGMAEPLGLEVYGLFDIECGLRVAAENTVRVLEERGQNTRLQSIQTDGLLLARGSLVPPQVNLFHTNPDWLMRMFARVDPKSLEYSERLNVCVPFWELTELPTAWLPLLSGMDILLAPTQFIADAISASLPGARVVSLPQAVFLPDDIRADRARFGIPDDSFAVAMAFAAGSGVDRKNPWAAIEAFLGAFPNDPGVRLVVRLNEPAGSARNDVLSALRSAVNDDPRVVMITGELDYRETLTMYASCDAYLSMHRSEGLGLGPMEAMSLGLPVIATGWSGNMDFMTDSNSFPLSYRLKPVDVPESSPYARGIVMGTPQWAEPDVRQASQVLRTLRENEPMRREVGERAAAAMEQRRVLVLAGDFIPVLADAYDQLPRVRFGGGHARRSGARTLSGIHKQARNTARWQEARASASRMLRRR
jgi:glycosyltransferase involved in cell wall biosynthesis